MKLVAVLIVLCSTAGWANPIMVDAVFMASETVFVTLSAHEARISGRFEFQPVGGEFQRHWSTLLVPVWLPDDDPLMPLSGRHDSWARRAVDMSVKIGGKKIAIKDVSVVREAPYRLAWFRLWIESGDLAETSIVDITYRQPLSKTGAGSTFYYSPFIGKFPDDGSVSTNYVMHLKAEKDCEVSVEGGSEDIKVGRRQTATLYLRPNEAITAFVLDVSNQAVEATADPSRR